jgi:hypothetical protein
VTIDDTRIGPGLMGATLKRRRMFLFAIHHRAHAGAEESAARMPIESTMFTKSGAVPPCSACISCPKTKKNISGNK